jgi:hypothetical protein
MVFLEPFEDADMSFAERAASFESDTDFGARCGRAVRVWRGSRGGLWLRCRRFLSETGTRETQREKRGE